MKCSDVVISFIKEFIRFGEVIRLMCLFFELKSHWLNLDRTVCNLRFIRLNSNSIIIVSDATGYSHGQSALALYIFYVCESMLYTF